MKSTPTAPWASVASESDDFVIAAEAAPDGEVRLIYANPRVCEVLGYDQAELVGRPVTTLCGDRAGEQQRRFYNIVVHGEPPCGGSLLATKTRRPVYSEWSAHRVDDPQRGRVIVATGRLVERRRPHTRDVRDLIAAIEQPRDDTLSAERAAYSTLTAAATVFLDAQELPQLEAANEKAQERLRESGGLEALSLLSSMYESALRRLKAQQQQSDAMSMLAHDIRGPLNTVIGFAELLAETTDPTTEAGEFTRLIVRAANRVVDLTNEVIVAAQLERNEYKPAVERFDLLSLIESVVSLQPGGERVSFDFAADGIVVEADLSGVRHIISNLASNALKYSDADAPVTIGVRRDDLWITITIRDQGIGIPKDELPAIFDRFTRASNARASKVRGTGLGLYFVKQLVERTDGTITIESQVGKGTLVTVKLPAATRAALDVPVIVSIEPAGDDRSVVASELRKQGFVVRVVQTLSAAESVLRHEKVSLVISDVDYFEPGTLEQLRATCTEGGLPILATGAKCESAEPDQLRKPFVADDLVEKVEQLVPGREH